MALKSKEASVGVGLATAAIVYEIHQNSTPSLADMQGLPSGTQDVDKAERKATWMSAAIITGVSVLTGDPTVFIIGAGAAIAMAVLSRHATWTESATGASGMVGGAVSANDLAAAGPQMTQTESYVMYSQPGSEFVS